MPINASNQDYLLGHEYNLPEGGKGVWGGPSNGFMTPEAYLESKRQRQLQFQTNQRALHHLDEAAPLAEKWDSTGFLGGLESGEGTPGWWPFHGVGGTSGYDLNKKLVPVRSNATIQNMMRLKAASPTGATGFGNLSEKEGETLASTDAILDTRQSRGSLK